MYLKQHKFIEGVLRTYSKNSKEMLYKSNPIVYCVKTKKLTNLINNPCTIVDEDINYEINLEGKKQQSIEMPQGMHFVLFNCLCTTII